MLSATFHHWGGGVNDPDFSVDLTRSMAIFRTPEILYRIRRNCCPLRKILIPVFHTILGSQVAADRGCERDLVHRMNEGYKAWGALKSVLSNRGLGIKAKKCLYEGVIIPTALYAAEVWGVRSAERRKVNVFEMKCLRSLVGVS